MPHISLRAFGSSLVDGSFVHFQQEAFGCSSVRLSVVLNGLKKLHRLNRLEKPSRDSAVHDKTKKSHWSTVREPGCSSNFEITNCRTVEPWNASSRASHLSTPGWLPSGERRLSSPGGRTPDLKPSP